MTSGGLLGAGGAALGQSINLIVSGGLLGSGAAYFPSSINWLLAPVVFARLNQGNTNFSLYVESETDFTQAFIYSSFETRNSGKTQFSKLSGLTQIELCLISQTDFTKAEAITDIESQLYGDLANNRNEIETIIINNECETSLLVQIT